MLKPATKGPSPQISGAEGKPSTLLCVFFLRAAQNGGSCRVSPEKKHKKEVYSLNKRPPHLAEQPNPS